MHPLKVLRKNIKKKSLIKSSNKFWIFINCYFRNILCIIDEEEEEKKKYNNLLCISIFLEEEEEEGKIIIIISFQTSKDFRNLLLIFDVKTTVMPWGQ